MIDQHFSAYSSMKTQPLSKGLQHYDIQYMFTLECNAVAQKKLDKGLASEIVKTIIRSEKSRSRLQL